MRLSTSCGAVRRHAAGSVDLGLDVGFGCSSLTALVRPATMCTRTSRRRGPLAQLVEQGTFNPKVAGSIPSRPTIYPAGCAQPSGSLRWAIVQRQDSGFWFQLSRFESWWPSHFAFLSPLGAIFFVLRASVCSSCPHSQTVFPAAMHPSKLACGQLAGI